MPRMTRNQHRAKAVMLLNLLDLEPELVRRLNADDHQGVSPLWRDIMTLAQLHATLACAPARVAGE